MDVEYLEYELEVIDLNEDGIGQPDEKVADTSFANWFTDWRSRHASAADIA